MYSVGDPGRDPPSYSQKNYSRGGLTFFFGGGGEEDKLVTP